MALVRGGDADELGAVLPGPGDVPGRLVAAQPFIGLLAGIEKDRHVRDVLHDAGDHMGQGVEAAALGGDVDVHAVSGLVGNGLR